MPESVRRKLGAFTCFFVGKTRFRTKSVQTTKFCFVPVWSLLKSWLKGNLVVNHVSAKVEIVSKVVAQLALLKVIICQVSILRLSQVSKSSTKILHEDSNRKNYVAMDPNLKEWRSTSKSILHPVVLSSGLIVDQFLLDSHRNPF